MYLLFIHPLVEIMYLVFIHPLVEIMYLVFIHPLVEFMYLAFTRTPGESYRRRLRSCCCVCVTYFERYLTPLGVAPVTIQFVFIDFFW